MPIKNYPAGTAPTDYYGAALSSPTGGAYMLDIKGSASKIVEVYIDVGGPFGAQTILQISTLQITAGSATATAINGMRFSSGGAISTSGLAVASLRILSGDFTTTPPTNTGTKVDFSTFAAGISGAMNTFNPDERIQPITLNGTSQVLTLRTSASGNFYVSIYILES